MGFEKPEIQTLQKEGQLPGRELHHLGLGPRPLEPVLLEPLLEQAVAVALPVEDLEMIPVAVAENKKVTREGIEIHRSFHQHG